MCGTSAEKKQTVLVEDVLAFPGHIACDAESRSEIVVPILVAGEVWFSLSLSSFLSIADQYRLSQSLTSTVLRPRGLMRWINGVLRAWLLFWLMLAIGDLDWLYGMTFMMDLYVLELPALEFPEPFLSGLVYMYARLCIECMHPLQTGDNVTYCRVIQIDCVDFPWKLSQLDFFSSRIFKMNHND